VGSVIIFAIVTLWLIVMVPAVAAPFMLDRSKKNANVAPNPTARPIRTHIGRPKETEKPSHRSAA
jgi:hypothetical protein